MPEIIHYPTFTGGKAVCCGMKNILTILLLALGTSCYAENTQKSGIQIDAATVALSYKDYSIISITGYSNSTHKVRIVCESTVNGDPITTDETVDLRDATYRQPNGKFLYKVLTDTNAIVEHAELILYEYPYIKKAIDISIK